MKIRVLFLTALIATCVAIGCRKKEKPAPIPLKNDLPEFFKEAQPSEWGKQSPEFLVIANGANKIAIPQDLDFNPTKENELWVVNKGTEATGSSTVTFINPGEANQQYFYVKDGNAWHFMSLTSALAFSNNGNWATSPNVLDANHGGGRYTGPALWSSDLNIYGKVGNPSTQAFNGSHLDMVHQSPYCMGIAAEKDNVFWVFDGYYNNIIRYDFAADHGPGKSYHDDAILNRYNEVKVKRDPAVPSHLVLDKDKKWLYIVDGGNLRILRMDITTGNYAGSLPPVGEVIASYSRMANVTWEVFFDQNLQKPCGIDIVDNRLFISDYNTGEIICIDVNTRQELARISTGTPGIMGIKVLNGRLWYVNSSQNTLNVINPR